VSAQAEIHPEQTRLLIVFIKNGLTGNVNKGVNRVVFGRKIIRIHTGLLHAQTKKRAETAL